MLKDQFNRLSQPDRAKVSRVIEAIIAERPDLADKMFYVPARGNNAYTLIVEGEVFKAPKLPKDVAVFRREVALQKALSEAGVEGIPPMTCLGKHALFYAVKKIDGMDFDYMFMPDDRRLAFLDGVGRALARAGKAWQGGPTPKRTDANEYIRKGLHVWRKPELRKHAYEIAPGIAALMDDYARRFPKRRAVLDHGDLHEGNMLVDRATKGFAAVIDWGLARGTHAPEMEFHELSTRWLGFPELAVAAFTGYCAEAGELYKPTDICVVMGFFVLSMYAGLSAGSLKAAANDSTHRIAQEMDILDLRPPSNTPLASGLKP